MPDETPLVRRTVRPGGMLLAVAAAQFVAVLVLVESRYPGFNMWSTSVTALGSGGSFWAHAFDASLIALGLVAALGFLFSWSAFDAGASRAAGLALLLGASAATVAAGAFLLLGGRVPAGAVPAASYLAVAAAGVGFLVVAFAMHRHERWRVSRAYTFATGLVVLAAGALKVVPWHIASSGGLERLVVAAAVAWAIVEGLHIALLHRFAPGLTVKVAAA